MTWPRHDAGSTTPEPDRAEPGPGERGPGERGPGERGPGERGPGYGRHSPDPLPPLDGPMPGGGPSPAETTLPLALEWPAPPAGTLRSPRFTPPGAAGPPG